jgi:hypothetical protein
MVNLQEIGNDITGFEIINPKDVPPGLTAELISGLWQKMLEKIKVGEDIRNFTDRDARCGLMEHWYFERGNYLASISVNHDFGLVQFKISAKPEIAECDIFRLQNGIGLIWMKNLDWVALKTAFCLATIGEKILALLENGLCLAFYRQEDLDAVKAEIGADEMLYDLKYKKIPTVHFLLAKKNVDATKLLLKEKIKFLINAKVIPENFNLILAEDFLNRLAQN